ncbi:uncharacterized protein LOC110825147 [Carica papaya]|uniref:uncharacterized protein LOC110825147 n=1 Tax=Carica papaya TaxID=3649 RepID=UPI000B8D1486|nr:uncharacterized protein LOC110825147 [Carica papaya]
MAIQIVQGFRANRKVKHLQDGSIGLHTNTYLIIRLPDYRILKLLARSMLLALFIVSFPWLRFRNGNVSLNVDHLPVSSNDVGPADPTNVELLKPLFLDLKNEGLLKTGDKALFLSNNGDENDVLTSGILTENEMDLISVSDIERQSSVPSESFHFIFTHSFHATGDFIDRTLKINGIVAVQLNENPALAFEKPLNYKTVYLRQFQSTIMAMRKTASFPGEKLFPGRRLLGYATEAKKAALTKLEDVLLEPPRAASGKSRTYLKRTKYLPDLMGDSLESYPRRVFIDVGLPEKEGGSGTGWFAEHYPTRNLDFEMYKIETVTESSGKEVPQIGMSDWLRENVEEEEYVVMKAEAEVVEEMVRSKAIKLVDELFLECKPKGLGIGGRKSKSRIRAYWECLALYGKLRDEGVAVHQWWG